MNVQLCAAVKTAIPTLTRYQRRALSALLLAQGKGTSGKELQALFHFSDGVQANQVVGKIGRKVYAVLGEHPDGRELGEFQWWTVVATGMHIPERGWVWQLREEVVAALEAIGFAEREPQAPDAMARSDLYLEGSPQQSLVNRYERNRDARTRCIEIYGATCCVCDFDFAVAYGNLATGFIHVHHLQSLASMAAGYQVNARDDLRPVCANCHAVIHMQDPPRTVEAVRLMWASQRINRGPIS